MERPEERMMAAAPEMYEYVRICTNEYVSFLCIDTILFSIYRHLFASIHSFVYRLVRITERGTDTDLRLWWNIEFLARKQTEEVISANRRGGKQ